MAYPNGLFSAFSFIGFLLCAIPLHWHLEVWNIGTLLYMAWAGLGCLNAFINSVVWNNTVENKAPVWCDISSRFIIGVGVGLPAATLVVSHRLYKIASRTVTFSTRAEKRRAICIDLAIGLGIPILQMALQIIVEGHRFDIIEEVGCYPHTYNTAVAFPLTYIWPAVLNVVTLVFSCLNIRIFWKSARQHQEWLGSNKNANQNRYIRLIALCVTQLCCTLPISLYLIYFSAHYIPVDPWISWEDTHFNYSRVPQFPSVIWRAVPAQQTALELYRWPIVTSAFIFFAFFGFAEEALKNYRMAYSFASSRLRIPNLGTTRASSSSPSTSIGSFGPGFKKGMATLVSFKDVISAPGSHGGRLETMAGRKRSSLSFVSEYSLTSAGSIFDGIDAQPKVAEFLPSDGDDVDDDDYSSRPTLPVHQKKAAVVDLPLPPLPIATSASRQVPPSRLNSPLPHRPISSFHGSSDNV